MRTLIVIVALLASVSTIAQTQVPNIFEDGTPASAAEVNANFDALEVAIDALGLPTDCNLGDQLIFTSSGWECQPGSQFYIGGNISGLDTPNTATLTLNGTPMTLNANGDFMFPFPIALGSNYEVLVETPAPTTSYDERCVVVDGDGTVSGAVTDVSVFCFPYARLETDDFSDAIATLISQHFDSYSPNVGDNHCNSFCEFWLSNVADHSNCMLSAVDYDGTDYQPNVTLTTDYIQVNASDTLFGAGSVIVEISCGAE